MLIQRAATQKTTMKKNVPVDNRTPSKDDPWQKTEFFKFSGYLVYHTNSNTIPILIKQNNKKTIKPKIKH